MWRRYNGIISAEKPDVSEEELEKIREVALIKVKAKQLLRELVLHILFLWIVVSISFGSHDANGFNMNRNMKDLFVDTFHEKVGTRGNLKKKTLISS